VDVLLRDVKKIRKDAASVSGDVAIVPTRRAVANAPRRKQSARRSRARGSTKITASPALALRGDVAGTEDIQVVVQIAREKVLAVGGPVRVIVSLQ